MAYLSKEAWDIARRKWEVTPEMTFSDIAREFNVTRQAVRIQARKNEWRKIAASEELTRLAVNKADAISATREDPLSDEEEKLKTDAVDKRAEVLARHRREWDGARKRIYMAVKSGDDKEAKLGKLIAEALAVVQAGERKAWQLDEKEAQTVVVIERG